MAARVAPSVAPSTSAVLRQSTFQSLDERIGNNTLDAPATPPIKALSPPSRAMPSAIHSARALPPPIKASRAASGARQPQHRSALSQATSASSTPTSAMSPHSASGTTTPNNRRKNSTGDEPNTPNSAKLRKASKAVNGGLAGAGGGSRYEKTKTITTLNRDKEDREAKEREQRERREREKRERERRERDDARRLYDDATRIKQLAPPSSVPANGSTRARLIDRKPNLRVQTGRPATRSTDNNSPYTAGGTRKAALPASAKSRGMRSKKASALTQPQPGSGTADDKDGGLPGAVNGDMLESADPSHSGHDRHTSIMPGILPSLKSSASHSATGSVVDGSSSDAGADGKAATASGLSDHTLLLASTYLHNANHFLSAQHRSDLFSLRLYTAYRLLPVRLLVFGLILLNMLLSYLEEKETLQRAGLLALEFLLLVALGGWTALELYLYPHRMKQSKSRWLVWDVPWARGSRKRVTIPVWRDKWDQGKCLILAICLLDWLVEAAGGSSYRVAKPLRAYFLITYSHDTRAQTRQVFSTIQAMFIPFIMVLLLVFFETVMAMIFFHTADSAALHYFDTLHESFFSMFAVATTSIYPDITFHAIDSYGLASSFFFIFCLSIGLYVTVSLLIAYVYTTWREQAVAEYWNKLKNRETNLKNAYTLLVAGDVERWKEDRVKEKQAREKERTEKEKAEKDKAGKADKELTRVGETGSGAAEEGRASTGRGSRDSADPANTDGEEGSGDKLLSLTAWSHLFAFMHPRLTTDESQILSRVFFLLLTTTSTQECSQQDFLDLCEHLQSLTSLTSKDALPQKTPLALLLQAVFEHRYAQYARSGLAVLEVVMVAEYFQQAVTSDDMYSPVWPFALDCLYAVWLCVEIGLSIYINTWQRYIASPWKRASFTIAALSIAGKVLLELIVQPAIHDPTLSVYRAVTFFRLIRVLRVPLVIKRFRLGLKSLVRVFLPLMELFIYLIIIYYLWAVLGEACFGGLLDPNDPPAAILELDFYVSGYYRYFHFNDFSTSLFTLFHFMAVTNWHWTVEALMAVTTQAAFLYYLSFYFIVSICAINLVIAYLVETLEIAVKNLSMQRADKEADRRQRRDAELWAKEMIELEREEAAGTAGRRRASQDSRNDDAMAGEEDGAGEAEGGVSTVTRTITAAPTIEKRKKRIGVFEEDALKHAERNKDKLAEENEESLSRVGAKDSESQYAGIDEELGTAEQEAEAAEGTAEGSLAVAEGEITTKSIEEHKEAPKASPKSATLKALADDVPHSPLLRTETKAHLHGHKMPDPLGSPRASVVGRVNQSAISPSTAAPLADTHTGSTPPHTPVHAKPLIALRPPSAALEPANAPHSPLTPISPPVTAAAPKASVVGPAKRVASRADSFKPPPPIVVKKESITLPKLQHASPNPNPSIEPVSANKHSIAASRKK